MALTGFQLEIERQFANISGTKLATAVDQWQNLAYLGLSASCFVFIGINTEVFLPLVFFDMFKITVLQILEVNFIMLIVVNI